MNLNAEGKKFAAELLKIDGEVDTHRLSVGCARGKIVLEYKGCVSHEDAVAGFIISPIEQWQWKKLKAMRGKSE